MRDLIDACLRFYKKDGEGRIFERLPINFRISLNSPRFMNREWYEKERRAESELDAIIKRVSQEGRGKVERLRSSLGKAAWEANRTEDVEWQLAGVIEALEDDRLLR